VPPSERPIRSRDTVTRQAGPEIEVARADGASGGWLHLSARPSAPLAGSTKRIEGYEEFRAPVLPRTETPMLAVPIILVFGGGFSIGGDALAGQRRLRSFVAGLHRRPVTVSSSGDARCIQVDLTPQAAIRFLRCDLSDLVDRTVDLADILGAEVARLEDRLDACPAWEERLALAEAFLARRLAEADRTRTLVDLALSAITRSRGAARIGSIAALAGCSRRHLATMVRTSTGLSPKFLSRIARFEHAATLMTAPQRPPLAWVAAEAGYADQAHLSGEFRALAGMTPRAYQAEAGASRGAGPIRSRRRLPAGADSARSHIQRGGPVHDQHDHPVPELS
jgi:AraC-like DNA-binding protein